MPQKDIQKTLNWINSNLEFAKELVHDLQGLDFELNDLINELSQNKITFFRKYFLDSDYKTKKKFYDKYRHYTDILKDVDIELVLKISRFTNGTFTLTEKELENLNIILNYPSLKLHLLAGQTFPYTYLKIDENVYTDGNIKKQQIIEDKIFIKIINPNFIISRKYTREENVYFIALIYNLDFDKNSLPSIPQLQDECQLDSYQALDKISKLEKIKQELLSSILESGLNPDETAIAEIDGIIEETKKPYTRR